MKRFTVAVEATATTQVIVEARNEQEALKLAERKARALKSRFLWGYERVTAARIRDYAWDGEEDLQTLAAASRAATALAVAEEEREDPRP